MAKTKYIVTCSKYVEVGGKWYKKTTDKVVEAESKVDAEYKIVEQGYLPISTRKLNGN